MTPLVWVGVTALGGVGAIARFLLDGAIAGRVSRDFPYGTFAVNISGAFALGLVFTVATERWSVAPWIRGALTIGFLGAYTTFSTLSFETYRLAEDRALGLAAANLLGSCAAGLGAVYLGIVIGRTL